MKFDIKNLSNADFFYNYILSKFFGRVYKVMTLLFKN